MKRVIFALLMIIVLMTAAVCTAAIEDDVDVLRDLLKKADEQYDDIRYSDANALGSPLPQESWNYTSGLALGLFDIFDNLQAHSFVAAMDGEDFYGIPNAWLAKDLSEAEMIILAQQVSVSSTSRDGNKYWIYAKLIRADPKTGEILDYSFTPEVYLTEEEKEAFNLFGVDSCKEFLADYADKAANPNGYQDRYDAAMALFNDGKYYSARQEFIESKYGDWKEMAAKCIRRRPSTGELWHDPNIWVKDMYLTFRIDQPDDTSIFIRLFKDDKPVSYLFVAGPGEVTAQLPGNGYYTVKDGIGTEWYGEKEAFGPDGSYETMTFDETGAEKVYLQSYYEYTISINIGGGGTGVGSKDEDWESFAE